MTAPTGDHRAASPGGDANDAPSPATAPPAKKRRRWRRIIVVTSIVVIVLAFAMRVTIAVAFPSVLKKVAAAYDLDASYERMELYLLGSDVGLWHLKLTPKTGGEPILESEYCRADVSALNLLRGKLVVRRVEADGVTARVEREADGTIPLLQKYMSGGASKQSSEPMQLTLDPPLQLDALRLSRVRARWRDRSVQPPVDTELDMTMRLSDVGSLTRPARFLLDMTSPPLLDNMRVEGEVVRREQAVDATFSVIARGVHPKPAAGYLLPLGLRPVADDISLRCAATIEARTSGPASTTRPADIVGDITIENVALRVDGRDAAAVDRVAVKVDAFNGSAARLASVLVDGVHAAAERTAAGDLRVAGVELAPAAGPTSPASPTAAAAAPSPAATQPAMRVALADLTIRNVRMNFADASVAPPANLAFVVNTLNARNIVVDPDHPQAAVTIAGDFAAPGVARSIRLTGTAVPFASTRALSAKLVAEGVRPEAIRAYLEAAGVESTMNDATATCDINASVAQSPGGPLRANVIAQNIRLSDGAELFAFDAAKLTGFSIDARDGGMRVDAIDLSGPRLSVRRDADGSIHAVGIRTRTPATQPAPLAPKVAVATASPAPTTAPAVAVSIPQLEIGRLTWKGVALDLTDRAVTPPTAVKITDAGIELANVRIGGKASDAAAAAAAPGQIKAWVAAPGIAKQFTVTGTIVRAASGASADLAVVGTGLNADLLAPYLKAAGVEPTLRDGSLSLRARANASAAAGEAIHASLALEKVRYADADQELIGVDNMTVDGVELRPDGVTVAAVQLDRPRGRVARDADGSLRLAGLRITPPTTRPADADAVADTAPAPIAPATAPSTPFVAALRKLRINGAVLSWTDRAVQPPVDAVGRADVELDDVIVGRPADAAKLKIAAKVDQTLESLSVAGTVSPDPAAPQARLKIAGSGIRAGVLAPYLPPGMKASLKDGRFAVTLDAGAAPHPQGGHSARLVVSDFDYRDQGAAQPFMHFDGVKLIVARADIPGGVVAVEEVSLSGLETELRKGKDQSMQFLGLTITQPPAVPTRQQGQPMLAADAQTVGQPHARGVAASPTTGPTDANKLIARDQQQKLPLITLDKLDVQLKRVAYIDDSRPDAKPIALADVRLRNTRQIELLGPDAASRPPVELALVGRIDPLVNRFTVGIESAPFAAPATLQVKLAAEGIRGHGVTDLLPELREQMDGSALTDGRFAASLEAQAKIERRGPAKLDFTKPFEATFSLRGVEFRAAADGPVLAGVDEVRAEPVRVDPQTGSVAVRTLEISKPIGRAYRDADGLHLLGLLVREPAATTQPQSPAATQATPPSQSQAVIASNSAAPAPAPPARAKPSAEFRIDKLLVSGIDVEVEDRTVTPPLIAPLNALEMEVRDLSNLALYEDRPIRFNVTAGAGKVPVMDGKEREMFSEVTAAGTLSLYPAPHGWTRSSVSGLEMTALRGPAAAQKVSIDGGVFDSNVDVRIGDDGVIDTRSRFAFTDLRMSEPKDGPVRRVLKLPGPLDTVIIVLQDTSGAITVPLNVRVEQGNVGGGQIAGALVAALGPIVTTAMASAPLKAAEGVTSLVGLDNAITLLGKKPTKGAGPLPAGEVAFAPGVADPVDARDLDALIRRMQKDKTLQVALKHEIGGGDVVLAAARANPAPDQCLAMAAELRRRKAELLASRPQVVAQARALVLARPQADDPLASLRALDRQLGATEDALDRLYELLRPGADRQADRRTRAACLQLAEQRLAALNDMLAAAGIPDAGNRVRIIRPTPATADGDAGGRVSMIVTSKKKL